MHAMPHHEFGTKHLSAYSAVCCQQFLLKERRAQTYRCMDCQDPTCAQCDRKPEKPVSPNHLDSKGKWHCNKHRYPPCSVCRITPRPEKLLTQTSRYKEWVCNTCQDKTNTAEKIPRKLSSTVEQTPKLSASQQQSASASVPVGTQQDRSMCINPLCENKHGGDARRDGICESCNFPNCANCGRKRGKEEGPLYKGKKKSAVTFAPWYPNMYKQKDKHRRMDGWIETFIAVRWVAG